MLLAHVVTAAGPRIAALLDDQVRSSARCRKERERHDFSP
jgi:hypothetical protein